MPGINPPNCPETAEPDPRGPVASDAQGDQPAEADSPIIV